MIIRIKPIEVGTRGLTAYSKHTSYVPQEQPQPGDDLVRARPKGWAVALAFGDSEK